jgi:CheY-like chemotaxis protein
MSSHILVIEDDQSIGQLFQLILELEGYEVTLAQVPFEEVSDIAQLKPDLLILDLRNGRLQKRFLLLHQLRMYPATQALPIILSTTALREVREQEEVLRQKEIPIITKPFELDAFLQAVHQFLPGSSSSREVGASKAFA